MVRGTRYGQSVSSMSLSLGINFNMLASSAPPLSGLSSHTYCTSSIPYVSVQEDFMKKLYQMNISAGKLNPQLVSRVAHPASDANIESHVEEYVELTLASREAVCNCWSSEVMLPQYADKTVGCIPAMQKKWLPQLHSQLHLNMHKGRKIAEGPSHRCKVHGTYIG